MEPGSRRSWGDGLASFLSTYTFKVDRKGRLSVPSSYRQILARNEARRFIAVASPQQLAIRCCGLEIIDEITAGISSAAILADAQEDPRLDLAAEMHELSLDEEGRMILPKALVDHAQIVEQATFVGKFKYFEIWEPGRYQEYRAGRAEQRRQSPPLLPGSIL